MSEKAFVLETVQKLSEDSTIDEIVEALSILAAIRRGEEAAEAGKLVSHEEVKRRFDSWNASTK